MSPVAHETGNRLAVPDIAAAGPAAGVCRLDRFALLLLCAALGACTAISAPQAEREALAPIPYFHDEWFAAPSQPIRARDVFALDDTMEHYLRFDMSHEVHNQGPLYGMLDALYRRDRLMLSYDAGRTRNAAEAFDARKGNCLSLVIMTAAFAKALGLQVTYEAVTIDETWSRSDDLLFLNTHVNLTLGRRMRDTTTLFDSDRRLTIDFLPSEDLAGQRSESIPEEMIVAMYMNNRAAEALAQRHFDDAYWWARAAIVQAPDFPAPYNTLGVVYLRHGNLEAAQAVLRDLLDRKPRDKLAMSNLVIVLDKLGRADQAQALRERLAKKEPYPPYHFFWLGTEAMQKGDFRTAKSLFRKEVDRADYCSEFHFWLGLADLKLGDLEGARQQIAIAMENSTTASDHDVYAAKLERLRSHEAH